MMDGIMNFLYRMYNEKLDTDDRTAVATFVHFGYEWGIVAPKLAWLFQVITILVLQVILNAAISFFLYEFVVRDKRRTTATATTFVFGCCLPALLLYPFLYVNVLDVRNRVIRMCVLLFPTTASFRILECYYGTLPPEAEVSRRNFLYYWSSVMEMKFKKNNDDDKHSSPLWISLEYTAFVIKQFLSQVITLAILFTLFSPVALAPFATGGPPANTMAHSVADIFSMAHLGNNFVGAVMICLCLHYSALGLQLVVTVLFGVQVAGAMDHPMFLSTSPSDFWGRRWNRIIHAVLKRGVYLPARKYWSRTVATCAAFVASGLMHEYVAYFLFYISDRERQDQCPSCYEIPFGKSLLFFGWNGALVMVEFLISHWKVFQHAKTVLPKPVLTMLVILTALPVGHWFTGDWIAGHYFTHMQIGFPRIVYRHVGS